MANRRTFTPEFKAKVVLELLTGAKSSAVLCREHQLAPQVLASWKADLVSHAAQIFARDTQTCAEQARIAELERLVGRLTLELEVAKKVSSLLSPLPSRSAKSR